MDVEDLDSSKNELDELTRSRFKSVSNELKDVHLVDKITALAFAIGALFGMFVASLIHKYFVHPLGW